jgi:hypothetical protein
VHLAEIDFDVIIAGTNPKVTQQIYRLKIAIHIAKKIACLAIANQNTTDKIIIGCRYHCSL